jgi:manganese/zinc/iron transport system permease protein
MRTYTVGLCLVLLLLVFCGPAEAARISDITETSMSDQVKRFFSLRDPSVRYALLGSILLGACCSLMGSFLIVRKMALMGDALSHAVLPGVALGFLWNMEKDPVAIFIGAVLVGLLGAGTVQLIRNTTRHKEDAALGFVLASFFSVGICLFTMIQNLPGGNRSGLDKFMFGQAAAMGPGDVTLLAVVAAVTLVSILFFFKEFKITSFDAGFARSYGLPVQLFHYGLMLLLAFAIVSALQAVGVVLVSAMLVIPAAAAYLLTDRLGVMLILASIFGMCAGAAGTFMSFVGRNLPTGPFMVLAAGAVFAVALFFGPRHGLVSRWWRQHSRAAKIRRENTLKALYRVLEDDDFTQESVTIQEFCEQRRETIEDARRQWQEISKAGLATLRSDVAAFTPEGWQRACEVVRNHRLWELYLTNAANVAADHVHEDAEKVEHILGEDAVRQLERRLNHATRDPHGKLIPSIRDIHAHGATIAAPVRKSGPPTGYGSTKENA